MITDKLTRNQYDFNLEDISERVGSIHAPFVLATVGSSRITGASKRYGINSKMILNDFQQYLQLEKNQEKTKVEDYKSRQRFIGEHIQQHQRVQKRKLHEMQEVQRNKLTQECTFKPKINGNTTKRNFGEFLEHQKQHVAKVNTKKENIKKDLQQRKPKNSFKPKVNPDNRRKSTVPVFERLYESRQKDSSLLYEDKYSFQPKITEKGKKMQRTLPIDQLLYCDALRRQEKARQNESIGTGTQICPEINLTNQKFAAQKFIKEYFFGLSRLEINQSKIDYLMFNQLLEILGFIMNEEQSESTNSILQRALVYNAYQMLEQYAVNARNVCVFLLALLGIYHINPINFEEAEETLPTERELSFEVAEGRRVQKEFDLLYRNRLFSQGGRKGDQPAQAEYSFHPQINKESEQMAERYREKMLEQANELLDRYPQIEFNIPENGVISHSELLVLHRMAKDIENQQKRQDNQDNVLSECTFKPTMYSSHQTMSQTMNNSKSENEQIGYKKSMELYNHHKNIEDRKKSLQASREVRGTDKECTFKPKINSQMVREPTGPVARQTDEMVYRLRKGHQSHLEKKSLLDRGETSKVNASNSSMRRDEGPSIEEDPDKPSLIIDVNMGDKIEQIFVYEGDEQKIPELARRFAHKHGLDIEIEMTLVEMLKVEIESVLDKIDEDDSGNHYYQ